jgi:hypothetical protein
MGIETVGEASMPAAAMSIVIKSMVSCTPANAVDVLGSLAKFSFFY